MKNFTILFVLALLVMAAPAIAAEDMAHDHAHGNHSHDADMAEPEEMAADTEAADGNTVLVAEDVVVEVFGLVCDFCARAVEKVFSREEAVEGVSVNLDAMLVTIDLKAEQDLSDDYITKLINDAGYTVNAINRTQNSHDG